MNSGHNLIECRVAKGGASALLSLGVPLLMLGFGVFYLVASMLGKVALNDFGFYFLAGWTTLVLWFSYRALSMPRQFDLGPDGWMHFRGPLCDTRLHADDVLSISPVRSQPGYLELHHRAGTLRFVAQVDGLHVFLTRLRELNPSVQLSGS